MKCLNCKKEPEKLKEVIYLTTLTFVGVSEARLLADLLSKKIIKLYEK